MQLLINKSFEEVSCYLCGCLFALESNFRKNRVNDHADFFCPNGHSQYYGGKTEADKLREELSREISRRSTAEHEKEKLDKKLKRVENGVCPECNRSFLNLQRHIKTKHSDCKKKP